MKKSLISSWNLSHKPLSYFFLKYRLEHVTASVQPWGYSRQKWQWFFDWTLHSLFHWLGHWKWEISLTNIVLFYSAWELKKLIKSVRDRSYHGNEKEKFRVVLKKQMWLYKNMLAPFNKLTRNWHQLSLHLFNTCKLALSEGVVTVTFRLAWF